MEEKLFYVIYCKKRNYLCYLLQEMWLKASTWIQPASTSDTEASISQYKVTDSLFSGSYDRRTVFVQLFNGCTSTTSQMFGPTNISQRDSPNILIKKILRVPFSALSFAFC